MKLIYVASPLAGDVEGNIKKALGYSRFVITQGEVPLAPHTIFTQILNDRNRNERDIGVRFGIELLKRCDELWVFGSFISGGMKSEIGIARRLNIPIRYFDDSCEEVST